MGCGLNPPLRLREVVGSQQRMELDGVPFHPQEAHHCGPASLLTLLEASGVEAEYDAIVDRIFVPGLEGSLQVEMLSAARGSGRIAYVLPAEPGAVLAEVEAGRPVLVLLNLGLPKAPKWHYAVVVGFDPARNRILLHSGRDASVSQRAAAWLRRWDWGGRWAVVLLRPGEWPAAADRQRLLRALADFEDAAEPLAARRAWSVAAERWPDEPVAWLGLGNAAYRDGDLAAAREAYRRILRRDPGNLPAHLNLLATQADEGAPCDALRALGPAPADDHPLASTFAELEDRLRTECPPFDSPSD